jgi:hypothetical protein
MAFLIGGANSAVSGYDIENSIRLNLPDEARLSNDPGGGSGSDGSRTVWTFSCWFKRSRISDQQYLISAATDGNNYGTIKIGSNDKLYINLINSGSDQDEIITNAVFRDMSAWYHVVVAVDKTEAALGDGIKIYINGVRTTSFGTSTYAQNEGYHFSRPGKTIYIGVTGGNNDWWQGYMAEVHFIDGTQKAATDFGETDEDSGIWKPIKYSGAYGTYGYFLEFKETGTSENSSGIGADTSGNDEHFAVTNLAAIDQCTDTPTNNFATLNPLIVPSEDNAPTLSEGNCKVVTSDNGSYGGLSTIGVSAGKWYAEFKYITASADVRAVVAVARDLDPFNTSDDSLGQDSKSLSYRSVDGNSYNNNSTASYGDTWAANDIIGIALDLDNLKVYFSKNGTWQNSGDPTSGATGTGALTASLSAGEFHFIGCGDVTGSYSETLSVNFGNPPYANSSSVADANGYGAFEYAPPSGYYALCTKNLAKYGG